MKAKVTISRNSSDEVNIVIRYDASKVKFVSVKLDLASYALLITGLSEVEGELSVNGLENVGKRRVREARTAVCPYNYYDKKQAEQWLQKNKQE